MNTTLRDELATLHERICTGDESALAELQVVVYQYVKEIAHRGLRGEKRGHTWNTTDLAHEILLRLVESDFFRLEKARIEPYLRRTIARVVRRLLVDHARAKRADKRGGKRVRIVLDKVQEQLESQENVDALHLHEALDALRALNCRQAEVVELRFFGGCTIEEVAEAIGVSPATVENDWRAARGWIFSRLSDSYDVP